MAEPGFQLATGLGLVQLINFTKAKLALGDVRYLVKPQKERDNQGQSKSLEFQAQLCTGDGPCDDEWNQSGRRMSLRPRRGRRWWMRVRWEEGFGKHIQNEGDGRMSGEMCEYVTAESKGKVVNREILDRSRSVSFQHNHMICF